MNSVGTKRKLTTIMAADVVGYSRLVAADDATTVRRLHAMREVIAPLVTRHDGRLFGEAGDSLMAEFPSAVEAVRCALEIQEAVAKGNAGTSPDTAMNFRIGIDIGEVIVEGDNLYGDGVNIAARLQEVAEAGGVALSGAAHEQIKNKVSIDVEPLGPRKLKNIPQPVPVFRVRNAIGMPVSSAVEPRRGLGWRRRAAAAAAGILLLIAGFIGWDIWVGPNSQLRVFIAQAAQPVPTLPSIVVMPFLNASENEAQDYFCLGMAEDIITSLTKVRGLFVVGRDSAMSLKAKGMSARQVGRELGVRYVLQGSVRRADNRVRISTYLVDAATEQTVWAARYDRELGDIFAVQDDIAGKITTALAVSFRPGERESLQQVAQVPVTYDRFLQARRKMIPPTRNNVYDAESIFQEVAQTDPTFAGGYAGVSIANGMKVNQGFLSKKEDEAERKAAIETARKNADTALKIDPRSTMAMYAKATAMLLSGDQAEAAKYAREAYNAQPGDAYFAATLGVMLTFEGRPTAAYEFIDQAIERERVPAYRIRALFFKLAAAYEAEEYETAERAYLSLLESGGSCFSDCLFLAASTKLALSDDKGKSAADQDRYRTQAVALMKNLRERFPEYETSRLQERIALYKDGDAKQRMRFHAAGLAKALAAR